MPAPETSCTGYRPSRPSLLSVKRIAERYYDKVGQHSTPAAVITAAWRGPLLERQGVPQRMVITNQGDLASWSCARGMHLCAAAWYTRATLSAGKLRGERPCTHEPREGLGGWGHGTRGPEQGGRNRRSGKPLGSDFEQVGVGSQSANAKARHQGPVVLTSAIALELVSWQCNFLFLDL